MNIAGIDFPLGFWPLDFGDETMTGIRFIRCGHRAQERHPIDRTETWRATNSAKNDAPGCIHIGAFVVSS
jgi:hypothetical protein